ncbi:hypothetical protein ACFY00_27545 [Kitasatospora sp. NPDC001540]|uniref:hypothetical protein n=1 Tax=Kitasatospora sp. NPDC001540 TaxID=3364014 RepID=UPI0036ADF752
MTIPAGTTHEYQALFLALTLPNSLLRMAVSTTARENGTAAPMFGWGAMATVPTPPPCRPITVTWEQPPCTRPDPPSSASRWRPGSGPRTCP